MDGKVGPDSELVELVWLPIAEAKSQDLPTITQVALDELQARVAKGFGHDLPSPFYRMLHKKFVAGGAVDAQGPDFLDFSGPAARVRPTFQEQFKWPRPPPSR